MLTTSMKTLRNPKKEARRTRIRPRDAMVGTIPPAQIAGLSPRKGKGISTIRTLAKVVVHL